jgi:hypothetical protein
MSADSLHFAGVVLITASAIAIGGVRLLTMIFRREPGYLDNPVRQNLWRADHAHAGALVILTLVGLLLVGQADLSSGLRWLVRYALVAGPILMPFGLFLSIASPRAVNPNPLIYNGAAVVRAARHGALPAMRQQRMQKARGSGRRSMVQSV